jgi:ketosteroid isomerase-like protein
MKKILHLLSLSILFAYCQTASKPAEKFDLNAVKAVVEKANKTYGDRFTNNDSRFYQDRYCKDVVIFPANHARVVGVDSIRAYYYNGGQNKELTILITTTDFYGSLDLVVEEGDYDFPDGKGGSSDKGKFMALWKQEEGKWKLFREIWNTDLEPVPPTQ